MQKQTIQMEIKKPILIFLALKTFTWASLVISALVISGRDNFLYKFKHMLINWDAIWYLRIALEGYAEARKCAFFPLMPVLSKLTSYIIPDIAWAGLLLSFILGLAAAVYFYNLARQEHGDRTAWISLALFLSAPTAVFYTSMYTEPLFFLLAVASFYHMQRREWLAAALMAGLASATRNVGILLVIPLVWEYVLEAKENRRNIFPGIVPLVMLACSGLAAYMIYLQIVHKDALMFLHAAQTWTARSSLSCPFLNIVNELKNIPAMFSFRVNEIKSGLSFIYFIAALALAFWGAKKTRYSFWLFLVLNIVILAIQPGLMSISRYISVIFTVWLLAAMFISERKAGNIWAICAAAALLIWQAVINFRWMTGMWVG